MIPVIMVRVRSIRKAGRTCETIFIPFSILVGLHQLERIPHRCSPYQMYRSTHLLLPNQEFGTSDDHPYWNQEVDMGGFESPCSFQDIAFDPFSIKLLHWL